MVKRLIGRFHARTQPWMTRQSYIHERASFASYPIAVAMVEGGVMGVLARKAFDVPPFLFAAIMAAPMFANLTSFLWARLARGKRKVKAIAMCQAALAVCVGAVALLPQSPLGAWFLTGLVIAARCMAAGVVTLRSTVWRLNYPREVRGQITGRLVQLNMLVVTLTPLLGYPLLDWNTSFFRVLYPLAMGCGIVGALAYRGVRLRGERSLLRSEQRIQPRAQTETDAESVYEASAEESRIDHSEHRTRPIAILRRDWRFRRYVIWQFAAGLANMTGEVAVVYYIARFTEGLRFEYLISIALSATIPAAIALVTLPLWAPLLDRMHIARFRVRQSAFWVACQLGHWLGAVLASVPVLILPRVLQGIARGGGALAWNLGHNDFASRQQVATYMGIHVTLTGIRGVMVPFIAMALVRGWPTLGGRDSGSWIPGIPGFAGIGPHVFAVTTGFAIVAMIGFYTLQRAIERYEGQS